MNLILCGLPLSGKSTLGKELAGLLGWRFTDTDRMIEEHYEKKTGWFLTHSEIFRQFGESYFRELEHEVLKDLSNFQGTVVATGGGVLLREDNLPLLKQAGILLYLKVDFEKILERLRIQTTLPAYLDPIDPEAAYLSLAKKRLGAYETMCDLVWDWAIGKRDFPIPLVDFATSGVE